MLKIGLINEDIPANIPHIPNNITEFSTPNLVCIILGNKIICPA